MTKTRIFSLVLCFVMLFSVLVACGDKGDGTTTTTPSGTATPTNPDQGGATGPATDVNGYELDNLPDTKWDDEIYIFSWENQLGWEFSAESETGDTVKDEVYRRKQRLLDKYGITLTIDSANGDWDHRAEFIQKVEANQNETGEDAYDIVACYFAISGAMTVKGFFEDLSNEDLFPYIELSKPWWPDDLLGTAKVNNAVYAATGDITPTFIRNMSLTLVNLDMVEKYNAGVDVYDLVDNKNWTYEKLEELALGNSSASGADREFGLTMPNNVTLDYVLYGAGFTLIQNNEDGSIELTDFASDERYLAFYEYIYELLNYNKDVSYSTSIGQAKDESKSQPAGFQAGNSMFYFGTASDIQNYCTEVDFNFGILPMPMYKTATYNTQDAYYTSQGFWTTLYSVPTNSDDKDFASFVLEALASDAYRNLTPTWYETMFKGRFLDTPENARMFDVIHDNIVFDTARIFGTQISQDGGSALFGAFRKASASSNWTSYYTSCKELWEGKIAEINSSLGD